MYLLRNVFLCALLCAPAVSGQASAATWQTVRAAEHDLIHDPRPNPRYVPPPAWYDPDSAAKRVSTFVVNYNGASCPTGSVNFTPQAQAAFQRAVDIWASILNTNVTITIDACWVSNLPANILGRTGSLNFHRNFTNAPQSNTWYVASLANQLAGTDLASSTADMRIQFNSNFNWFLGLGAQDTDDQPNFVTVVLHEIAHGLGFSGFMRVDDGTSPNECTGTAGEGCWGSGDPGIYDRFTENGAGTPLLSYANNSTALGNQLTGGAVFFNGSTANILNGGTPPELYAPPVWNPGSSYSHLDETFNNTDDALMTFSVADGEVIHHPGDVTLGLLQDLGWDLRNLSNVWVDGGYTGTVEVGSPAFPFNTVFEGTHAVYPGGNVIIESGSYPEAVEMTNPCLIQGQNGTVIIGQ